MFLSFGHEVFKIMSRAVVGPYYNKLLLRLEYEIQT